MKSLKSKLILSILLIVIVSSLVTVSIVLFESNELTQSTIQTQLLTAGNNMMKQYLDDQFGYLCLSREGEMVDEFSKPIEGRYEYLDTLSQKMDLVATIFCKTGKDYTRILTTIKNDQGERAVGTILNPTEVAYEEVSKENTYFGQADILGEKYITKYEPMYDKNNEMIGVYFVGVPMTTVHSIVDQGMKSTIKIIIISIIVVLIIATIISYFVATSIAKPIEKVTVAAKKIANGNFDVELCVKSQNEVGQLAEAFQLTIQQLINYQGYIDETSDILNEISKGNLLVKLEKNYVGQFKKLKDNMEKLLQSLNFTLIQINQSADQVACGSEQVSVGAQALSQGATEQASSIEELSASITEITAEIKENAENAKSATDMAEVAGKELHSSNEQMKDMLHAMEQITFKSTEISKIIKVIDDIAFQTNILALNAAVEAARAGSAGQGFAVVADEVRNLAGKSAAAAKNTTALIEETIVAVENGSTIADKTAHSLETSAQITSDSVTLINKIAEASDHQAISIAQINLGVEQISSVVQTNAATSEESAAASEELSSQSNILKELISKFKLKETDDSEDIEKKH
ncbi:cache domain-containing protein [Sedimentibacter sp. zth1]|uniref:methyl-accepting chemotaxis protein n=1 Tax=Sedimentibacter sp. zth1 TaxID=2816908 RepID=UPI001A90D472|nr:methyl-accepting chemotaxis protein [Sedimentibacter sp. zth1]QSX04750.1 cache domain-containing protein [Sedimentibacter sp. zth1]